MGKLKNSTSLHTAILDNDIESVKKYASTNLLNVSCEYQISEISFYVDCTPLHLALLESKTAMAEVLLSESQININKKMQFIQMLKNHVHTVTYRPLDLAIERANIKIIDLLVSNPNIILKLNDVKALIRNLTTRHDENYFNSLDVIIKKCENHLLNIKIKKYEKRTSEQKHHGGEFFGGIPRTKKLTAAIFLKNNLDQVQTIEKHKDYNIHKKALTQGSKKPKKMHSSLCKLFSTIKEAELTIDKLKNPSEKDELELKTFSPIVNGPR